MALMTGAAADELVLPYSCKMEGAAPHLSPAAMTNYRIIGSREEQPFTACSSSAAWTCETLMVHKFNVVCDGQRVAWARVAASARALGIAIPDRLPPGFAPVSRLKGRFVLPGFGKPTPVPPVVSELLSPDAVIAPPAPRANGEPKSQPWVTVVDPVSVPSSSANGLQVAGMISTVLVSLMGACLLLARRRQFAPFEFSAEGDVAGTQSAMARIWDFATASITAVRNRLASEREAYGETESPNEDMPDPLAPVRGRHREADILVSMLPRDLLLRDVLNSELGGLHDRISELGRRWPQMEVDRLRSAVRAVMRDLDRIARIAQGAMPVADNTRTAVPDADVPSTVFEAYSALGLNADAPDAAVKKIVDALRMSWHPDHARDDADRRYREQRIKQVNAAWDLLKVRTAEAA
ncbi:MAG: J domain-containing protein [Hyphomicrobium sp.]